MILEMPIIWATRTINSGRAYAKNKRVNKMAYSAFSVYDSLKMKFLTAEADHRISS